MNKFLLTLALLAMTSITFTACGNTDGEEMTDEELEAAFDEIEAEMEEALEELDAEFEAGMEELDEAMEGMEEEMDAAMEGEEAPEATE
jgi:hypothetical protein